MAVVPRGLSLALFARLALHPTAAGRAYAAYGGVYVAVALADMAIIALQQVARRQRSRHPAQDCRAAFANPFSINST